MIEIDSWMASNKLKLKWRQDGIVNDIGQGKYRKKKELRHRSNKKWNN